MKKFLSYLMATTLIMIGSCRKYDDTSLRNDVNDLKNRVAAIERWAATVNSNISALQGLVAAMQSNDYVTGVTTFTSPQPGGYIISFVKNGAITISNGTDGQDGQDGADGLDGESPQVGVKQDADGVYYWTLNGEWIIDEGNKLRVTGEKGNNGMNPQIRINTDTGMWEVSYDNGDSWSSLGIAVPGNDGINGQDGVTPQMRINASNIWEVSYDNGNTWISLSVSAKGDDGQNGQDGVTPQMRINPSTKVWEVSYDSGNTWHSLNVSATGNDGANGSNGVTPQLRINPSTDFWEVSYNNGATWTSLGVKATGDNGQDGQNGITPQMRINAVTNEWEISYNDGAAWNSTGITATGNKGDKGDKGDAIFAANGVDNSNPDYVEFTLVGGASIKVPKYKQLGLSFTQPGSFTAGETKDISFTSEGNVAIIEFVNIPNGWKVSVNQSLSIFSVTAPSTFNNNNKGGRATILISDNGQHTIIRTVNFTADTGGDD
ncbi:MAG: DUF4988 domain-containing protein, partial [Tannerella sp.]|nr:DUF4988 domain-containing protein [Tannerella sp.]